MWEDTMSVCTLFFFFFQACCVSFHYTVCINLVIRVCEREFRVFSPSGGFFSNGGGSGGEDTASVSTSTRALADLVDSAANGSSNGVVRPGGVLGNLFGEQCIAATAAAAAHIVIP